MLVAELEDAAVCEEPELTSYSQLHWLTVWPLIHVKLCVGSLSPPDDCLY